MGCTIRNCPGGVHAFSAKFVGVLQGLFDDFRFGDFEACGSGTFDLKTGTKWNTARGQNETLHTGYWDSVSFCIFLYFHWGFYQKLVKKSLSHFFGAF